MNERVSIYREFSGTLDGLKPIYLMGLGLGSTAWWTCTIRIRDYLDAEKHVGIKNVVRDEFC